MDLKKIFRTGDDADEVEAIGEISWLDESGFWLLVAKNIEMATNNIYRMLKSENNSRDKDMYLKGELRGIQVAMIAIDKVKKNMQKKP
jgi:hypothetical protein